MPRPKIYHTKAERREANRVKNRLFYKKCAPFCHPKPNFNTIPRHRSDILKSKQVKREEEKEAIKQHEIRHRKKRQKAWEKVKVNLEPEPEEEVESAESPEMERLNVVLKTLGYSLNGLRNSYHRQVGPDASKYLKKLCEDTLRWKDESHLPLNKRPLSPYSPLVAAKNEVSSLLRSHEILEDELLYALRDQVGPDWDEKKENFAIYKGIFLKTIKVIDELIAEIDRAGLLVEIEDLSPIYCNLDI
ncbi:hypothetical protein AAF712_011640 [Marasmius tenuissimus]|uniref:Uncharacterized protein n=1 Tax=Marasmius tenuissimus TaxID=585030 RepID=A0ABR2ZM45_9AGAR